jgi:anti-sigma B factor antagonist
VVTLTASVTVHESGPEPYTLVKLAGEADILGRETLHSLLEAETKRTPGLLIIEMSALQYMDSAALQEIVRVNLALAAAGGRLALVSPGGNVARVLQVTEVDQLMPVYATLAEAVPGAS